MTYEKTPIKPTKGEGVTKNFLIMEMDRLSTPVILWHLVKRHKFSLTMTWAVVVTILYFVPFAGDAILLLIK